VELHNLPLVIRVGCNKRKDADETANVILSYQKREAVTGPLQQAQSDAPLWRALSVVG